MTAGLSPVLREIVSKFSRQQPIKSYRSLMIFLAVLCLKRMQHTETTVTPGSSRSQWNYNEVHMLITGQTEDGWDGNMFHCGYIFLFLQAVDKGLEGENGNGSWRLCPLRTSPQGRETLLYWLSKGGRWLDREEHPVLLFLGVEDLEFTSFLKAQGDWHNCGFVSSRSGSLVLLVSNRHQTWWKEWYGY
jgi:hypothetical protein